jgi:hypothetical protein
LGETSQLSDADGIEISSKAVCTAERDASPPPGLAGPLRMYRDVAAQRVAPYSSKTMMTRKTILPLGPNTASQKNASLMMELYTAGRRK